MAKEIELTRGFVALVDDIDFEYLRQFKWHNQNTYAAFSAPSPFGEQVCVGMHQLVLERKLGRILFEGEIPDHVDGNGLNNTRQNLRPSTQKQNTRNRRKTGSPTSSQFKGVSKHKRTRKWQAQIVVDGLNVHIGYFSKEEDAAKAYDQHAILWFGEFANLNFPAEWSEITDKLNLKN